MSKRQAPSSPAEASPSVNGWNADYILELHERWQADPSSVGEQWSFFFQGFELASRGGEYATNGAAPAEGSEGELQARVDSLIYHYRDVGHLIAMLDPLGRHLDTHPLLELSAFSLGEEHLDRSFRIDKLFWDKTTATLREILDGLKKTYCRSIGAEYMHIQNTPERRWLQERMERHFNEAQLTREDRHLIAESLYRAGAFEIFLQTNYIGQKRFSLEGGEPLIPLLQALLDQSASLGVREVVMGMPHRGRLNVLANIIKKSYSEIFYEFEDHYEPGMVFGDGDVKYHKGYSSDIKTRGGESVHMTLTANPSHLEAVNPVVLGRVRAKQRRIGDANRERVLGILLHGDAAFAGQGMVMESLNLSQLKGYRTGGSIHVIINNQIGFTTLPVDARSGTYCTDVAKMIQAPIFHVNGDDPEAVVHVAKIAADFRQTFHKDVVIDMYCYRRLGHNEGDEPSFTQPRMYDLIRDHPTPFKVYRQTLVEQNVLSEEELDKITAALDDELENAQDVVEGGGSVESANKPFREEWAEMSHIYSHDPVETGTPKERILQAARVWKDFPQDFSINKKVERILSRRWKAVEGGHPLDWATAEGLSFGTLLLEGTPVRLSGQDSRRGTFSHRHAALWDSATADIHVPLNTISPEQARFCVYDSPLSEAGVLGFDYGYSLGNPDMLICWEAQFGDFANGGQTIIDQFIATSESKWNRVSGLVMLLPHGQEGQGPEHSSGWMERFLQLFAEDNLQVCNMTTPAQYFHVLRRQMARNFRKPLIIMAPKSLLRHPRAVSPVSDLVEGRFHEVLDDAVEPKPVRRAVLCSGKLYYELIERRDLEGVNDAAIVRVEQVAPFPHEQLRAILGRYPNLEEIVWCQEEPQNKGAWHFVDGRLRADYPGVPLYYVGREASASPAPGLKRVHDEEQEAVVAAAIYRRYVSADAPAGVTAPAR